MLANDELPNYGRITGTLHLGPRARQTQAGVGAVLELAPEKRPQMPPHRSATPLSTGIPSLDPKDDADEVSPEVVKVVERLQNELADAKTMDEKAKKSQ